MKMMNHNLRAGALAWSEKLSQAMRTAWAGGLAALLAGANSAGAASGHPG